MINKNLLIGRMTEKGITCGKLALSMGMTKEAFSRMINGHSGITVARVDQIMKSVGLSEHDTFSIFFGQERSDN